MALLLLWQGCRDASECWRDDGEQGRPGDRNVISLAAGAQLVPRPAMYVKQSGIDGAGGGLFSGRALAADEYLSTYKGVHVKAATMRAPGYMRGYIMRVGPKYVDGRDLESGRLRLADGTVVDVSAFTHDDWGRLGAVGIEWVGRANLCRFVNKAEQDHNVIFRSGKLYTLREIPPDTELVVSAYGGDFWMGDGAAADRTGDGGGAQGEESDASAASTPRVALSARGAAEAPIERPTKKACRADLRDAALLTRELERAWMWYGRCGALPLATTESEVEAWVDRHLRSDMTDELLSGTAIVLAAGIAPLPPRLTWAARASEDMPADRREYAAMDGMLEFLARAGGGDQLELQTPSRAERPTVATLRAMLREGVHPAIEQPLPLITELPSFRRTDAQSVRLRSAILSLIGGEETMLPRAWLEEENGTVLGMLNDPTCRSALFVLAMHSRCNLDVHVDALGTGVKGLRRDASPAHPCSLLPPTPTPNPGAQGCRLLVCTQPSCTISTTGPSSCSCGLRRKPTWRRSGAPCWRGPHADHSIRSNRSLAALRTSCDRASG